LEKRTPHTDNDMRVNSEPNITFIVYMVEILVSTKLEGRMLIRSNTYVKVTTARHGEKTVKVKKDFHTTDKEGYAHLWLGDHNEWVIKISMCEFEPVSGDVRLDDEC